MRIKAYKRRFDNVILLLAEDVSVPEHGNLVTEHYPGIWCHDMEGAVAVEWVSKTSNYWADAHETNPVFAYRALGGKEKAEKIISGFLAQEGIEV